MPAGKEYFKMLSRSILSSLDFKLEIKNRESLLALLTVEQRLLARANTFWPTAVVGEADSVNSVSASACHIGGPKRVSPGQKASLHGISVSKKRFYGKMMVIVRKH